jgi:hypothetical protein
MICALPPSLLGTRADPVNNSDESKKVADLFPSEPKDCPRHKPQKTDEFGIAKEKSQMVLAVQKPIELGPAGMY